MKSWNRWCNNASLSDGVELVRPGDIDHGEYRQAGQGACAAIRQNNHLNPVFCFIAAITAALFDR
ncbi:hypothetical protein EEA56_01070 [Salmonella enterica subsp. enterica serovar Mapo]|uniref:Uncharacterized protein n=1 Tax=Salmonella enterica subsp. enterica serovar Moero TaxID=2500154 RepID=A0A3Q9L762_SALET|nr:hypothetical protein [Salmonella enterica]ASG72339.1 hypothetical protein CE137_18055 [Salmonella enterica subsp. enterica serovar Waycross]AZS96439.1 hypothetical protein ELZ95_16570 [Salmonella enterica subsp. enterica serovar Moero]EAA6341075.1 hypothetical protein [Salmonella enterica subsp. enterica serovar Veneziana]EBZ6537680.1 hypothetical protein [Salmonella enterica subsp. enterica serovar Mapo]ECB3357719.1 hypothetical protein [Salmonella enterica subsp. enterica serovar Redba]E